MTSQSAGAEFYVWRHYYPAQRHADAPARGFHPERRDPGVEPARATPIGAFEVVAGVATPTLFLLTPCSTLESLASLDERLEADAITTPAPGAAYIERRRTDAATSARKFRCSPRSRNCPGCRCLPQPPRGARACSSSAPTRTRARRRSAPRCGCSARWGRSTLPPGRADPGVLLENSGGTAHAEHHLHARAREHGGTRKSWSTFSSDPETGESSPPPPGYSDADIVSNITTVLLRPAAYSQI